MEMKVELLGIKEVRNQLKGLELFLRTRLIPAIAADTDVEVRNSIERQFSKQEWAPLSPAYAEYKTAKGRTSDILVWSGQLRKDALKAGNYTVKAGSMLIGMGKNKYAAAHHKGLGNLPARPFFLADKDVEPNVIKFVEIQLKKWCQ